MHYGEDAERAQKLIDSLEQGIIKLYRWAFSCCDLVDQSDCPTWVFYRTQQMVQEITELQEILREWEE